MSSSSKRIAVITRTRNRPLLLPRAAESILGQNVDNLVWVLVNDGGVGGHVDEVAKDFSNRSGNEALVIHNQDSVGMEAASNMGIAACDSDYVIIHDDDDSWEPGFLTSSLEFLRARSGYKGVVTLTTTVIEAIKGSNVTRLESRPYNSHLESVDLAHIAMRNQFPTISFLFSRSVYDDIGGFNEDMHVLGDWDFNLRFLMKENIGLIPEYLANYHLRAAGAKTGNDYRNTVVAGLRTHLEFETQYRHARYREDLANNRVGLGHLLMSGKNFQLLQAEMQRLRIAGDGWRKIHKIAQRFGFR